MGTVLVTGGAGIVGSHVIDALMKESHCERVVATYHRQKKHQDACPGVDYHVCNILDTSAVADLLDKTRPRVIIHTISPGPSAPADVQHQVNYVATKELLELALNHPDVEAFVYTSSVEAVVLGSGLNEVPVTENNAQLNSLNSFTGLSAYGRTKGAADQLVLSANTRGNILNQGDGYRGHLRTTTLRVGGLYGERDLKTIHEMIKCVNTIATRIQIGPDHVMNEWVYTENVAQAHVLAAKALLDDRTSADTKVDGESFFITDDSPMRFWEFSRKVWKAAGDTSLNAEKPARVVRIPIWVVVIAVSVGEWIQKLMGSRTNQMKLSRHHLEYMRGGCRFSVEKAKERLGYRPVCDTNEGIRRSVAWFQRKESQIMFEQ
ncbi:C-3 sterol dehydrogenase/C-4 decarboxylase-like protein [Massariosphaeria phaeospora]|uniref:C-3 sterol dehydrogenase/C-4 decarboxylase-like protein n=1 Tax=Massariosphaeria phaeospora TaxID=100035 RepID=A0A7C8IC13_9PLEO|nr:C-3 sterol dehydrogenase/C-4 decarboxylase-like protein [Massariosphaeria phaeospora]